MIPASNSARILLIDDHELLLCSLAQALECAGYEIHTAQTYEQAAAALSEFEFELMITDIDLGNHSGMDFIQQEKGGASLIFMSGNSEYLKRKELEPYPVLLKPFSAKELFNTIESSILQIQNT